MAAFLVVVPMTRQAPEVVVHQNPVWRERSNFVIHTEPDERTDRGDFEQLFAKQLANNEFEVCCIPFFVYDLALGDVVITSTDLDRQYIVEEVAKPSARFVFRVWFGEASNSREKVVEEIKTLGSLTEWSSRDLLAIDAMDSEHARKVAIS